MNQKIIATEIGNIIWKIVRFVILLGLSYILVYPVLYMISMAVRPTSQVMDPSVTWIPKSFTLDQFKTAIDTMNYFSAMTTTVTMGLVSTVLQLISCSMVGYGFARFKFKSSGFWFTLVMLTLIVPASAITIPLYFQYRSFSIPIISPILDIFFNIKMPDFLTVNMIDSWFVFWLPALLATGLRSGLYVYIFRQFYRNIPVEIEEAALVDGAGYFKTFYRIMVPNASGSFLTVFLFSIVWYWNDTFYSSNFITRKRTLAKALSNLRGDLGGGNDNYNLSPKIMAGALLFVAPMLIMYIFLQRYFVQSVERTGIVG
jgi:multiple sugar transport system permease protein